MGRRDGLKIDVILNIHYSAKSFMDIEFLKWKEQSKQSFNDVMKHILQQNLGDNYSTLEAYLAAHKMKSGCCPVDKPRGGANGSLKNLFR
ncbi:hypothetical protein Taro_051514 [Colocasia esculenta]|uniref:Uncharacterized protein n=1 Tax=Colocasia esculenta TaxID=4460 RepID=A0A843XH35_COLES|nr:hypothetical protein [Colocasia esculenta]